MASDLYIAFGADTGEMEAGLARAQAAVRATAAEMRSLASEMVKTGPSADSEMGSRLASLGSKLSEAKESVASWREEPPTAGCRISLVSRRCVAPGTSVSCLPDQRLR